MPARRTPSEVVGTESTPGGHRRPTDPRSGTGSRKGDAEDYAGGAGDVNKSGAKILLAGFYAIDPQHFFCGRAEMEVDSVHAGGPASNARERSHVEGLHVDGITVFRSVRAGVSVEAAIVAAQRAVGAADMRQAGFVGESGLGMSVGRTGFQARFSDT